ncbi:putative metal-dependent hydrolase [Macrococcus hajekii]|nr:TatD family hydrolase [Macrococcus hajekii]GGB00948.1 putative metal-dependent hydrolase [Macrococcus hajekii]
MYDSHIHLDQYTDAEIANIMPQVEGVIAVATDLNSSKRLLELRKRYPVIQIAAGFHPEQPLLSADELNALKRWIKQHRHDLSAVGEIGLPQYLRREGKVQSEEGYLNVLEELIQLAAEVDLPVALHAVYSDAETALHLLEHYKVRGHFHWFKAADATLNKVIAAGHYMSVTPDILWNDKTRRVAEQVPISQLMIETDGPWPHTGFGKSEISDMLSVIINEVTVIKKMKRDAVAHTLRMNTRTFYRLEALDENR